MNREELILYTKNLLLDIKQRVLQSQHRAVLSATAEMIARYWDIGQMIDHRQKAEGCGTGGIPRLAMDLKNELPELKGFSKRQPALATKWRQVLAAKWQPALATKWRQILATGVSPWFAPQPHLSVPKGRHASELQQGSCRPFGNHRGVVWSLATKWR